MSLEDSSPLRTGVRSVSSSSEKGSADRRPLQFWKTFNTWWRQNLEQTGRRPGSDDVTRWYELHADFVWGPHKPSLHETRTHAKCLRTVSSVREYFREYRKKKHDHAGSEDDEEDIVCRRASPPETAADAAESEAGLFTYSRRPSRDSGTPAASPGAGMIGTLPNMTDLQDSGHWQPTCAVSAVQHSTSRGGKTGRGRGRGRGRQQSTGLVSYEIHPGALGPDMMDAAYQAAQAARTAVSAAALPPAGCGMLQLQQPPVQPKLQLPGGTAAPGMHSSFMQPEGNSEAIGQAPFCSPRGVAALGNGSQGITAVAGGLFTAAGAAQITAVKPEPVGLELAYSMPWVREQQQFRQTPAPAAIGAEFCRTGGNGSATQQATTALFSSQGAQTRMSNKSAAATPCLVPGFAGAMAAGSMRGNAAGAADVKMESGLMPMPRDFLFQFSAQPYACQPQQPPVACHTAVEQQQQQQQQQVLLQQQQHLMQAVNQASLSAGAQQQPAQQQPHRQKPPELQRQPSVQYDLHQLHQQFIQEAKPTPRGFPGSLFSDNTNLGCDDVIPPPPLFSGGIAAGLPPLGLSPVESDVMQHQHQGVAAAAAAAAVGPSVGHNSAGILSELEAIKGPAMAGLVDAHCANQRQRISVSALLDAGPFGPSARRLSQGLDLHSGLYLPHHRLSLCAMGSDLLGDLLGDFGGLGDLDAFLGTTTTSAGPTGSNEPLTLPRISEGGCGAMAPPPATGRPSLRWNLLGDHWHNAAMTAPSYNHPVATAAACPPHAGAADGRQTTLHSNAVGGTHFGLQLDATSPRYRHGGLLSPPGLDYTAHAAAAASGQKRARSSTSKLKAGLMLDVNCVKRQRVSGLLMDMDTPKVRAMAVGAGITALTPKSPAVTPNRIAALAAALANAAAAARQSDDACAGKDNDGADYRELKKPVATNHKYVLNLGDSPVTQGGTAQQLQQLQQQQQALPGPAFQALFSGQLASGSPAATDKEEASKSAAVAAAPTAGTDAPITSKKMVVLDLCDEPTPAMFGKATAQPAAARPPVQVAPVAMPSASSGGSSMGGRAKGTKAFLPALHEIESMI